MEPALSATATCVAIGPYDDALTYGARYPVLAANDEGDRPELKIRNDLGRVRWYPRSCFDLTGAPAPQIATVRIVDALDEASRSPVEVEILLSPGEWRWCVFSCPEALPHFGDLIPGTATRLHAMPHLIVLSELTEERIHQALQFLLEQGRLLDHTRAFSPANPITPTPATPGEQG